MFKEFEFTIGPLKVKGYVTGRYISVYALRGRRTTDGWTWDEE